jgi:hypothetical protein
LLAGLVLLALVAAGGAFALSQRGDGSAAPSPAPGLFPARFSETGFLSGSAALVSSYDAAATVRRTSGSVSTRGTVYVVGLCRAGTLHVEIGGLTSSRACTGRPVGVIALKLTRGAQLTATVSLRQRGRWGVAIYRSP